MNLVEVYGMSPNIVKKIIIKRLKANGKEFTSRTLRNIFKQYFNIEVGYMTYGCFDGGLNGNCKIGNYTSIATGVKRFNANHPLNEAVMSAVFYNKMLCYGVKDIKRSHLEIGNDVWIGANVMITSRCIKIGNGAVIGAGSIVTKNVEAYSMVAGSPSKIIRHRFDEETRIILDRSEWWTLAKDDLINFYSYKDNPREFANKIIEYKKGNGLGLRVKD